MIADTVLPRARPRRRRLSATVLALSLPVVIIAAVAAVCIGSTPVAPSAVLASLVAFDPAVHEHLVIHSSRLPRTVAAVVSGAALGACGSLMQGLTRNPLADPGLLGVNAGAALFVVIGIQWLGAGSTAHYAVLAFAGAAVASVVVYGLAARGRGGPTPVKLTLAGAAFGLLLGAITSAITVLDQQARFTFGFWSLGNVEIRTLEPVVVLAPFFAIGLAVAMLAGAELNALSLGEEVAAGIGLRTGAARLVIAGAIVLLCGAATALVGPLSFVGLLVPFVARAITGPDYRWLTPLSAVFGALLVLGADVGGRVVIAPAQLSAGIMIALIGAPAFVLLARRSRMTL